MRLRNYVVGWAALALVALGPVGVASGQMDLRPQQPTVLQPDNPGSPEHRLLGAYTEYMSAAKYAEVSGETEPVEAAFKVFANLCSAANYATVKDCIAAMAKAQAAKQTDSVPKR